MISIRYIDTKETEKETRFVVSPSLDSINLIKGHKRRLTIDKDYSKSSFYKSIYKRLPMKLSSTNFTQVCILHIINKNKQPMYGSQIVEEIKNLYDEKIWKPSNGTLYPAIKSLVQQGLLEKKITDKLNNKKLYDLTEKGHKVLIQKKKEVKPMIEGSKRFFKDLSEELFIED